MRLFKLLAAAFLPLAAIVALPVVLSPRQQKSDAPQAHDTLVIITPHNEAIRHEFTEAFKEHHLLATGRTVSIDWRMPGGTSDIVRYVNDRFAGAFKRHWENTPSLGNWTKEIEDSFNNHRLDNSPDISPDAAKARKLFLESNIGIGIDLFFGGGQYEMDIQAKKRHADDAGLIQKHPAWFKDNVIPQSFSGETFYDPGGRYYGTCISSFGICFNIDLIRLKGMPDPGTWDDLGGTDFLSSLAVADPTKSGSVNKCFEMMIQQAMAEAIQGAGGRTEQNLDKGWSKGLNLIKRIGANSRYITDSASKIPRDVAVGETTAGICIDFYGRTEAEWAQKQNNGAPRLKFVTPIGGSSVSADPIMLFRGAPNRDTAIAFIEVVLSKKGQRLWNSRQGTPGGTRTYALRRLPIRKDMYTEKERQFMSDPDEHPFSPEKEFIYDPSLTARYFSLIRTLVKIMVIDPLPELQAAWHAIAAAGGPGNNPEAMRELDKLPFKYENASSIAATLNPNAKGNTPLSALRAQREMADFFRIQYVKAANLAKKQD